MAFSDKLKELLHESGMKAADLARATQLSEAAISDYLKGKKEPRGRQSISIAKALGVSLDTLWETEFDISDIGKQIREARRALKYTQFQVAEAIGISPQFMSKLETGQATASIQTVYKLAKFLNVSIDSLLQTNFNENISQENELKQLELLNTFDELNPTLQDYLIKTAKDLLSDQLKMQSQNNKQ